jgi:dethiobiotin synthetase
LVPLTRELTYIDVIAQWCELLGVAFIGEEKVESQRIIVDMGQVRRLGRLPHLAPFTSDALREAFTAISILTVS